MARKLVKTTVREIKKENPNVKVEVLYASGGGWDGHGAFDALPESEWGEYRTDSFKWYGNGLCVVHAV